MKNDLDRAAAERLLYASMKKDLAATFPEQRQKRKYLYLSRLPKTGRINRRYRNSPQHDRVCLSESSKQPGHPVHMDKFGRAPARSVQRYQALQYFACAREVSQEITNQFIALECAEHIYPSGKIPQISANVRQFLKQHMQILAALIDNL